MKLEQIALVFFSCFVFSIFTLEKISNKPQILISFRNNTKKEETLRSLANKNNIMIGTAVRIEPLQNDSLYRKTIAREFNVITTENALKFGRLQSKQHLYDFRDADVIVGFAKKHGLKVRGHTLVWYGALPRWLTKEKWTRDELIEILREHITTVVSHFKGRVDIWDVVNEAIFENGFMRKNLWLKIIGPEYIDSAFYWANRSDSNAKLFYNDYGGEGSGIKSDSIFALVRKLKKHEVPIDGVGLQMHIRPGKEPKPQDVFYNIKRLSSLGLDVHITEMDVRLSEPVTEEKLLWQASIYKDMLKVCLSLENCKALVFWGFTDLYSWIPHHSPGMGEALIFDKRYRPKPAYNTLIDELSKQK